MYSHASLSLVFCSREAQCWGASVRRGAVCTGMVGTSLSMCSMQILTGVKRSRCCETTLAVFAYEGKEQYCNPLHSPSSIPLKLGYKSGAKDLENNHQLPLRPLFQGPIMFVLTGRCKEHRNRSSPVQMIETPESGTLVKQKCIVMNEHKKLAIKSQGSFLGDKCNNLKLGQYAFSKVTVCPRLAGAILDFGGCLNVPGVTCSGFP